MLATAFVKSITWCSIVVPAVSFCVAVAQGEFSGGGVKLILVLVEATKSKTDRQAAGEFLLVLNISQQLDSALALAAHNWPNITYKIFAMELDKRYGVNRMRDHNR